MPGDFGKKLGRRVAELRKRAGLTQLKLAEKVDVAVETVSRLERGVTLPGIEKLAEIAKATGTQPYEILKFPRKHSARDGLLDELSHELRRLKNDDLQLARDLVAVVVQRGGKTRGR